MLGDRDHDGGRIFIFKSFLAAYVLVEIRTGVFCIAKLGEYSEGAWRHL